MAIRYNNQSNSPETESKKEKNLFSFITERVFAHESIYLELSTISVEKSGTLKEEREKEKKRIVDSMESGMPKYEAVELSVFRRKKKYHLWLPMLFTLFRHYYF